MEERKKMENNMENNDGNNIDKKENIQISVPPDYDNNQTLSILVKELESIKTELNNLKNNKIIDNLQLPSNILEDSNLINKLPKRLKRGRGARPLLESEIREAQDHCKTANGCSKYLNVGYNTYAKWAKKYGIFKTAFTKREGGSVWDWEKGKYKLSEILEGKFPDFPVFRLKDLVIRSGIKMAKCEKCGRSDRREKDRKMPLLLNFIDGNNKNQKPENLIMLCYSCSFVEDNTYIKLKNARFYFDDPDRIQGADSTIKSRF